MPYLNPNIKHYLNSVLLECGSFETDSELQAVFVDGRINPWQKGLPQANNQETRVEVTIDYLINKTHSAYHENALVLLLKVLADRKKPQDICKQKLDDLATDLTVEFKFQDRTPTSARPAYVADPPPHPRHFQGREHLIERLEKQLKNGATIALWGMAGVGKTALATVISANLSKYFSGGVFWGALEPDAERLILTAWGRKCDPDFGTEQSLEMLVAKVRELLLQQQSYGPQLFVIDTTRLLTNERSTISHLANIIRDVLPANHALLLTVRDQSSPLVRILQATPYELKVPSAEIARAILMSYVHEPEIIDKEAVIAQEFLEYVGFLPLAIKLAAGCLNQLKNSPRQYSLKTLLDQVRNNPKKSFEKYGEEGLGNTFASIYQTLSANSQKLFRWLGVFSNAPIRPESIAGVLGAPINEIESRLSQLRQFALLEWLPFEGINSQQEWRCKIHPTIHLYSSILLRESGEENAAKEAHVKYYLDFVRQHSEERSLKVHDELEATLPNIMLAIQYANESKNYTALQQFGYLLCAKSHFFNMRGAVDQALRVLSDAKDACEKLNNQKCRAIMLGSLGLAYEFNGEYENAIRYMEDALAVARSISDKRGEAIWLERLGERYRHQNQYSDALQLYSDALSINREIGDKRREAIIIGCLGRLDNDKGEFAQAIEKFHQAQQILTSELEIDDEGQWVHMLGLAFRLMGQVSQAIHHFEQAIEIHKQVGNLVARGESYGELGLAYYLMGNIDQAEVYFEKALSLSQRTKNRLGEAKALANYGLTYRYRGQIEESIGYLNQALKISKRFNDSRNQADSHAALGIAYRYLGKNQESMEHHEQALAIRERIGDRRGVGASLGNIGNSLLNMGRFEDAFEKLQQGLQISREVGDQRSIGNELDNIGRVLHHRGESREALKYLQEALNISRQLGLKRSEANRIGRIGNAYLKLGDVDKAIQNLEEARLISEKILDERSLGNHLGYLGKAYLGKNHVDLAEQYLQKALDIARKINDRRKEGIWIGELGVIYEYKEEIDRAFEQFEKAVQISVEVKNRHSEGINLTRIGGLQRRRYQTEDCIRTYTQALEIQTEVGDVEQQADILNRLGNASRDLGLIDTALEYYKQSLSVYEKVGLPVGICKVLGNLGSIFLAIGQVKDAVEHLERALQLSETLSDPRLIAYHLCLVGIAYSLQDKSRHKDAVRNAERGLAIRKELIGKREIGKHMSYVGEVYLHVGVITAAEKLIRDALAISKAEKNIGDEEWALSRLGRIQETYNTEASLYDALNTYREAFRLSLELKDKFHELERRSDLKRTHEKLIKLIQG